MSTRSKQVDNRHFDEKLLLRRHLLDRFHPVGQRRVLDCCQGEGKLWHAIQQDYPLDSYFGLDKKPTRGRLKVDSSRVIAQLAPVNDVIDIDTYGSPWKHYLALLPAIDHPTTVFLTIGCVVMGNVSKAALDCLGIRFSVPGGITKALSLSNVEILLGNACHHRLEIKAWETSGDRGPGDFIRYIACRLTPTNCTETA